MTPYEIISMDEVIDLLEQITARDQRTTGETDVTTWWHDLNTARINYKDAQAAANYYYAVVWPAQKEADRFRLTAPKVIELVKKVREERLENFVYEPTPGETGAEFVANYHRQRNAIASGHQPPVASITQALKPRPVKELLAGAFRTPELPPEIAEVLARRRPPGTAVACPSCHAAPNRKCHAPSTRRHPAGRELTHMHPTRLDAWATAVTACPTCEAAPGDQCTEYGRPYANGAHHA
ncbi:MAG TPA: hypothetical protein VL738_01690, partial [Dactylosporangium sp.]|nr:hypothetical protein [Dactylosporangium sp.]